MSDPLLLDSQEEEGLADAPKSDIDPTVLNLLQQWNLSDDDAGIDTFLADNADLLKEPLWEDVWNDDASGWTPPIPVHPPLHEDGINDEDPFFYFPSNNGAHVLPEIYCQPCNDPLVTVPWFLNYEDDDNEEDSFEEQLKDLDDINQEDVLFWQAQYRDDDLEPIPWLDVNPVETAVSSPAMVSSTSATTHPEDDSEALEYEATLENAIPYVAAFSTTVFPPETHTLRTRALEYATRTTLPKTKQQVRECYGHTERILGCAVSHDQRFLATASQDSTVRVWNMATHQLLQTLSSSSKDYECLRVAWTHTSKWGKSSIVKERYLLATGGADGKVGIWGCPNPLTDNVWTLHTELDHAMFHSVKKPNSTSEGELETIAEEGDEDVNQAPLNLEPDETPQIYALQFIVHWAALASPHDARPGCFLMTSSDDYVHVWEWVAAEDGGPFPTSKKLKGDISDNSKEEEKEKDSAMLFQEVLSLHFTCLDNTGYGVQVGSLTSSHFGGARNPHNRVYVFDASYCTGNGTLGVALSDGTLRLMNGRGVCLSVLQLPPASEPGFSTHLTSFAWDRSGRRLATTVATGHLVTWNLELINPLGVVNAPQDPALHHHSLVSEGIHTTCCAVMDGGHSFGKPLYGCQFIGEEDGLLFSYGSDGRICLWDSRCDGEVHAPLAILWDNPFPPSREEGYPIYAMAVSSPTKCVSLKTEDCNALMTNLYQSTVVIAGGGTSSGGLLGMPVYLQDVYFRRGDEVQNTSLPPATEPV